MVTGTRGKLAQAEASELPAHRRLAQRDAKLLENPGDEIDDPPAHDAMHGRDRSRLDDLHQRAALLAVELGRIARCFAVDEAFGAAGVETQDPIANRLQSDTADPRRIRARTAVENLRQRQKPPRLTGVARYLRKPSQITPGKIVPQRDSNSHGESPPHPP